MDFKENRNIYKNHIDHLIASGLCDYSLNMEHFGFIPSKVNQLLSIDDVYKEGMTFLDVGCGYGNVMKYASNIGYDCFGIENNADILEKVRDSKLKIINKDAREVSRDFISMFDVVFCYTPINLGRKEFLINLTNKLSCGQIIIIPSFGKDIEGCEVKHVGRQAYMKKNKK